MEHPPKADNFASISLQQNNSNKAVVQANGLVDVTLMSQHIAAMSLFLSFEVFHIADASSANRNTTTSRLLQLPGELRNQIWEYTLSYPYIALHLRTNSSPEFPRSRGWAYTYADPEQRTSYRPLKSALHLPETCRQIYNETATLAYQLNTFVLSDAKVNPKAYMFRTSAQMLAVRTIQLRDYEMDPLINALSGGKRAWFSGLLGLKRLEIVRTSLREPAAERIFGLNWRFRTEAIIEAYTGNYDLDIVWLLRGG